MRKGEIKRRARSKMIDVIQFLNFSGYGNEAAYNELLGMKSLLEAFGITCELGWNRYYNKITTLTLDGYPCYIPNSYDAPKKEAKQ